VDALTEFRVGVGREAGADAVVRRLEGVAAVLAEIMASGGDPEVDAVAVADDGVHAEAAVAGVPLTGVLVVADAGNHLPRIAAVAAAKQRGRFDAAEKVVRVGARFNRPDVRQRAAVAVGERRRGLRLVELLTEVVRDEQLHPEEGVAARGVNPRRTPRVDHRRVDGDARAERTAEVELLAGFFAFGDEQAFLRSDGENDAARHDSTS
jgi:hypothetical protein